MSVARWAAPAALAVLFAGLLAPYLFVPDAPVLSAQKTDIAKYFLHARSFAAEELRAGNVPLWNPHLLAGTPFVGGFQSAVFYPPNLLYLLLPAGLAINVSVALHLLFAALVMRRWALHHGQGEPAATLAGALLALGGPLFARVHAGHLTILEAAPWMLLTLLAVDWLVAGRRGLAMLSGSLALAMMVLVGHPQTAFFGAVAATIYAATRLPAVRPPARVLATIPVVLALAAGLSAVQWWTAWQEAPEAIRSQLSRDTAARFSLPLDSLATLVAPEYFGPLDGPYWGGSYPWEVTLFCGAGALFLSIYGAAGARFPHRVALLATMAVLFLLAIGAHGPFFGPLFEHVPGFDRFRAWSRFSLPLAMFGALLAAAGFRRLLENGRPGRAWAGGIALLAIAAGTAGLLLRESDSVADLWSRATEALHGPPTTNDTRLVPGDEPRIAGAALLRAALSMLLLAGALAFVPTRRHLLAAGVAAIAVIDPLTVALSGRGGFSATDARFDEVAERARALGDELRVHNSVLPNSAMTNGTRDVRGYDPALLRRSSELLEHLEHEDDPQYESISPLYALLRLGLIVATQGDQVMSREVLVPMLPRLALYGEYEYAASREAALTTLAAPGFDFRRTVVLEQVPAPRPSPAPGNGEARVLSESTDHLEIEVTVAAPTVLLVTDAYHPFWRATSLPGSSQSRYEVLPANVMLRGVPLEAGVHRIRLEYRVPGFEVARVVSALTWGLWIIAAAAAAVRKRRVREPVARHR